MSHVSLTQLERWVHSQETSVMSLVHAEGWCGSGLERHVGWAVEGWGCLTWRLDAIWQSVQFRTVTQLCPSLCDPTDWSTPGLPVHHQLPEFTQTHVHWVSDDIQPSHPLSSPSPTTFNLSQHQGLFRWVSSSHQVAKVLEFQPQHQSFQWIFRTDFL